MDYLFKKAAWFYYQLARLLYFTDLFYNKTTKRLERQRRNPRKRRIVHRVLFWTIGLYDAQILVIPLILLYNLSEFALEYDNYKFSTIPYVLLRYVGCLSNAVIILYQMQRGSTSKILLKLLNTLFEINEKVTALTGLSARAELYIKLLLLSKLVFIIWDLKVAARSFQPMTSDIFGFPIFELAYFAKYMLLLNLLKLYQILGTFIKSQSEQLAYKPKCNAKCKEHNELVRKTIMLCNQNNKVLGSFLERFSWFEKLVVFGNLRLIRLLKLLLTCINSPCYKCEKYLPNASLYIFNMLLYAMVNDELVEEEETFYGHLTIIVGKLPKRDVVCEDCKDLLKLIDEYFCRKNIRSNNIKIMKGISWSKVYMFDHIHGLILIAINMAQSQMDELGSNCTVINSKVEKKI